MAGVTDRDVERARAAYERVKAGAGNMNDEAQDAYRAKYKSGLRQLPSMLQMHGFGQTMAFHMAKAKAKDKNEKEDHMQRIWQDVLHGALEGCRGIIKAPSDRTKAGTVIKWLTDLRSLKHRILLMEALECASWMKRWAEILIPDKKKDDTAAADSAEVTADASNVAQ